MASHLWRSSVHGSFEVTSLSTLYLLYDRYGGRATSLSVNTRVLLGTTPSPRPISHSTHALCWESLTCFAAQPPCQPRNLQLRRNDTDEWDCQHTITILISISQIRGPIGEKCTIVLFCSCDVEISLRYSFKFSTTDTMILTEIKLNYLTLRGVDTGGD